MSSHKPRLDGSPGETDPIILTRRQRQIDFGKNSASYQNYVKFIPRDKRYGNCPNTPNKYRKASRRGFDGMIRKWRIEVHQWNDAILEMETKFRSLDATHEESDLSHRLAINQHSQSTSVHSQGQGLMKMWEGHDFTWKA